jgi:septum formation protein
LILASGSARRRELLEKAGVTFEVVPPNVQEPVSVPAGTGARTLAESLAYFKAAAVAAEREGAAVLAADTVVALDDRIIGKPADEQEAREILEALSGTRHQVITGVALLCPGERRLITSETTHVTMRAMSSDDLDAYVASREWVGKAGAYAIQETADRYVEEIEGSFTNVVGLPMELVERMVRRAAPGAWPN